MRLGLAGDRIVETASSPDAEPFVDSGDRLLSGTGGLYMVSERTIARLETGNTRHSLAAGILRVGTEQFFALSATTLRGVVC